MGNQVASLSRKGYLTDVAERADRVFAYYLASDKSQSYLYAGNVLSMQATIQEVGNNQQKLQSQITQDLATLFNNVFDLAAVTVAITTPAWDGTNRFNIAISTTLTDAGTTYDLGTLLLQSQDGIVTKLVNANNG
jgi:hypothetical protein